AVNASARAIILAYKATFVLTQFTVQRVIAMAPASFNSRFTPEKLLLLLVLLTLVVLVFNTALLETRLVITPASEQVRFVLDSDVQDGGNTQTQWLDKNQLSWRCNLGKDWPYPFCAMQIHFSDSHLNGIDLSRYTHLN